MHPFPVVRLRQLVCALPLLGVLLTSCEGFTVPALDKLKAAGAEAETAANEKDKKANGGAEATLVKGDLAPGSDTSPVDLAFLLTMNYTEAASLSGKSLELGENGRVAAESIEVLKSDKDGNARKLRAVGKVYLETGSGSGDSAKILCQEAYINGDEAVLRGRPILQRGGTIIEGLADDTVFYFLGSRLRVIGLHRVTNPDAMVASIPDLGPWTAGPNPLLPALNESAVPSNIREEMMKAAEAEAVLRQNRDDALQQPDAPPAPWVKPGA